MKLNEIIAALKKSQYECAAGRLENSTPFVELEKMANNFTVCCLGPDHSCMLNVNNGYCAAQLCQYQVRER